MTLPASKGEVSATILPRLMLEVSTNGTLTVAVNTPLFEKRAELDVDRLITHIKNRTGSRLFKGYVFASLFDCEDLVTKLDLYPHVFQQRLVLYNPKNSVLKELCALISMTENLGECEPKLIMSIFHRAKKLFERNPNKDSFFLFRGLSILVATHFSIYNPDSDSIVSQLPSPLVTFKLHATIEHGNSISTGLLKSIFMDSYRMDKIHNASCDNPSESFTLLCSPSIFTKHLTIPNVIMYIKQACMFYESTDTIIHL